jgi:hypothetical protein
MADLPKGLVHFKALAYRIMPCRREPWVAQVERLYKIKTRINKINNLRNLLEPSPDFSTKTLQAA